MKKIGDLLQFHFGMLSQKTGLKPFYDEKIGDKLQFYV